MSNELIQRARAHFNRHLATYDPVSAEVGEVLVTAYEDSLAVIEHMETVEPLPDPHHMPWVALRDALWERFKDDEWEDEDLCVSRAEACALLSWASSFDLQAQPRRDEEEEQYAIIREAAESLGLKDFKETRRDAERWRALLRCARIRMQGSAGFDPATGERREYDNETGTFIKDDSGWVLFGAEFWSIYPNYTESKTQEERDADNLHGRNALIALADDVLLKERQAKEQAI